jgi:hypothetical protein
VGSEESTPGSGAFEIAIRPALLYLVSALSLPQAILLRFIDRQRHELSCRQVAESAPIRNRAMAQQLGQHGQRLVGEILVDERFLSAEVLSRAELWRFAMAGVFLPSSSVKTM